MNGPRTWTTVWGLTVGVGGGLGRREQRGGNCDNSNRITIKKNLNVETEKIISFHGNASLGPICPPETGIEPIWPHKCVDTQRSLKTDSASNNQSLQLIQNPDKIYMQRCSLHY